MPGGEIQLVAYGEENIFLNHDPQITFFKITYRRYTNFSIETVKADFVENLTFGNKFTFEIPKIGDLMHKFWLVIELPNIPIVYDLTNNVDNRLRFAWARKTAYALIDYIDVDINGQVIDRQWGEWMNVLNELNTTNFDSRLNQYIGNTPEYYEYKYTSNGIQSLFLYVPLQFWFFKNSGFALPLLCLEYSTVRVTVQLKEFENVSIFSPSNYIRLQSYLGNGIQNEPLLQVNDQGYAWAEFDSLEVESITANKSIYKLYYRKISNISFTTTKQEYYDSILGNSDLTFDDIISTSVNKNITLENIINNSSSNSKFFIYGLYSKSIFIPISTNDINFQLENTYLFKPLKLLLKNMYLLMDFIYIDRDERIKFFNQKHEYVIEQVFFTGIKYLKNLFNKNSLEIINPCKWLVYMGQMEYLLKPNVNDFFNYKTTFIRNELNQILGKSVIKNASVSFNSNQVSSIIDFSYYDRLQPFLYYPQAYPTNGMGVLKFCLYPLNTQPSGSINMSSFNNVDLNTQFRIIEGFDNEYVFKSYAVTYNVLRVVNGVAALIFSTNY